MTSNTAIKKTTSSPARERQATTKPTATGAVLPVTDPLDLWYLCEKAAFANGTPYRRAKDNQPMYQRTVSQLIRADNVGFRYKFPYCGEVGYDMTVNPPQPIMSKREPFRPSTFPISQYQQIRNKIMGDFPSLRVETDLLSKSEVESMLSSFFSAEKAVVGSASNACNWIG